MMTYKQWVRRIVAGSFRGERREKEAIAILAYMFKQPECKVWADVERERVKQEQLG